MQNMGQGKGDMNEKSWKYDEGIAIGIGLTVAGFALQACCGKIRWELMSFPVNVILLVMLLAGIVTMHLLRRRVYLFRYLSSYHAAICSTAFVVGMTVVMGLCIQVPSNVEVKGLFGIVGVYQMLSAWHLVLIYIWMVLVLGLSILRVVSESLASDRICKSFLRRTPFLLNHLGLFIAIVAGTLGNADMRRVQMICNEGQPEWRGVNLEGGREIVHLPFAVELNDFTLETYDNSRTPRRFASDVTVYAMTDADHGRIEAESVIEVNKPIKVGDWKIYQSGYDVQKGNDSQYSVLDLVKDPWLPAVYVGIYLLLAGAVLMMLQVIARRGSKGRISKIVVGAIILVFAVMAYFFIPVMTNKELVPALQSPWFAPHVLVYMFAYTLMGATVLIAIFEMWKKPQNSLLPVTDNLVYVGAALIAIGMLFGALWAKEAWGHYWSWDPKETWAAITWLAYLVYIHYRKISPKSITTPALILFISFVLLNVCWWGINYLPSAQGVSVHVY